MTGSASPALVELRGRGKANVTDISTVALPPPRPRMRRREDRPSITLPNGKVLEPRVKFAGDVGLSEKTVRRMNLPTTYIGCVAYIDRDEALKQIGACVKRRNEPPARRRRPR
jgi:hypothetical protein